MTTIMTMDIILVNPGAADQVGSVDQPKTAKALGLVVPQVLLLQAARTIE